MTEMTAVKCEACNGRGQVTIGYSYVREATCFKCKGTGVRTARQIAASQNYQKMRQASGDRAKANQAAAEQWKAEHKVEWVWISTNTSNFARSLSQSLTRFGRLTDHQLTAVQNIIAKNAEAVLARAAEQEKNAVELSSTDNVDRLTAAFEFAKFNGVKRPKFIISSFRFSAAPSNSVNAGAIYIKKGGGYLGKIANSKFYPVQGVDQTLVDQIREIMEDPFAKAIEHGRETGVCSCCNKMLTDEKSIAAGIGPVCAKRYGWKLTTP